MLLFLPVLTGLLLVASFPKAHQPYLAWIAFIPLIAYLSRVKTPLRAFGGGWIAGAIELFTLLIWMPPVLERYGGLPVWLAWTAYALLILVLSSFSGAACYITKQMMRRGGDSLLLLFPAVWILLEYVQTKIPFGGFPWLLVGYTQPDWLSLAQIADLTGVFGVSFLVLWFGGAVFRIFQYKGRTVAAYWPIVVAVLLIAGSLVYGRISLNRWDALQADNHVAMLQGNLSPDESGRALEEKYIQGYVQMAGDLKSPRTDLLVLPESPTPVLYQSDDRYRRTLEDLARRYTYGMIFNNIRSDGTGEGVRYYNSAFFLDRNGVITGVYDKTHLVPFGEYIPLSNVFVFIKTITMGVGEFHPGRDFRVLRLGEFPVNAVICFEAIFPDLVRKFVRDGSRLIVNLTNDGWYGDSAAPYQHFSITRWRAIENRRYFLRAANSGISAVITPAGRIQTATGVLSQAVCEGSFAFVAEQTFYTRYGDVFVFLCAIIVCSFLIPAIAGRRKKRQIIND
jgi:apolipoprotein N-acyltransferase